MNKAVLFGLFAFVVVMVIVASVMSSNSVSTKTTTVSTGNTPTIVSEGKNTTTSESYTTGTINSTPASSPKHVKRHAKKHSKVGKHTKVEKHTKVKKHTHSNDHKQKPKANIVAEQGNVKLAAGCTAEEAQGRKCSGWCKRNPSNGRMECNSSNGKSEFWTIQKIKEDNDKFSMKIKHNNSNKWCQWVDDSGWRVVCNADAKGATSFHLEDFGSTTGSTVGHTTFWHHDPSAFDKVDIMKQLPGTFALLDSGDTTCKTRRPDGFHNISRSSKDRVNIMKQCFGTPAAQTWGWNTWVTDIQ